MILRDTTNLVAQIQLPNNTYRVSDRAGITLDSLIYDNTVISWGNVVVPWGLNGQVGTFDMKIANGQAMLGSDLKYPIDQSWNNGTVIVKKWYSGDTNFSTLKTYYKGIIKNFKIDNQVMSFTVDGSDKRNGVMLPFSVTEKTDDETTQSLKFIGIDTDQIALEGSTQIFSEGDIVFLYHNSSRIGEYAVIKQVDYTGTLYLWFESDLIESYSTGGYDSTIEFAGNGLTSDASSRVVPLQFGNLNDGDNAKLGKMMLINNTLGYQKLIADSRPIHSIASVGVWEPGYEKYFEAQKNGFVGDSAQKEFDIINNYIDFTVDTTATLTGALTATDGLQEITVSDAAQIAWEDETGDTTATSNDIVTVNVIIIDTEMMLIAQRPVTPGTTVLVERGYNDTTVASHSSGAKIRQSPKYGLRNLLVFTYRFLPIAVTNFKYATSFLEETEGNVTFKDASTNDITDISDIVDSGYLRNMINENESNFCSFNSTNVTTNAMGGTDIDRWFRNHVSFDLIFKHTEKEYQIIGFYPAMKIDTEVEREGTAIKAGTKMISEIRVYNTRENPLFPDLSNDKSTLELDLTTGEYWEYVYLSRSFVDNAGSDGETYSTFLNTFATINRSQRMFMNGLTGTRFDIGTLKTLNKPWKFAVVFHCQRQINGENTNLGGIYNANINNLAFWIDFGVDYTRDRIVGEILGRKVTGRVAAMNGSSTAIGDVATHPMDVIALVLTEDMNYTSTDTTSSFFTVTGYMETLSPVPEVAFSYGLNEKPLNGWKFVQKYLCEPFNIVLHQDHAGLLKVLNLHDIFNNMSPTSKEISLGSIRFVDGMKLFNIQQTGTNTLYNDFVIKYQRNNATDTFMKTYRLPDNTTFANSALTLSGMRTAFYGGEKRTKTIECPAMWNKEDAERLAKTQAAMYAEPHFYVTFSLHFEHYQDFNSESEQYEIGDIIHFTGKEWGITFDSSRLFLIQHIEYHDAGRSIEIRAFSLTSITNTLP